MTFEPPRKRGLIPDLTHALKERLERRRLEREREVWLATRAPRFVEDYKHCSIWLAGPEVAKEISYTDIFNAPWAYHYNDPAGDTIEEARAKVDAWLKSVEGMAWA